MKGSRISAQGKDSRKGWMFGHRFGNDLRVLHRVESTAASHLIEVRMQAFRPCSDEGLKKVIMSMLSDVDAGLA